MRDKIHLMQDIIAWLILLESWESQLHHGVSHFLRRKFCEKWKFAVYNELLNFWSILTVRGCDVGRWNGDGTTSYFNIRVRELIVLTTKIVGTQHMILNCVKIAQSCTFFPPATQFYLLCRELVKKIFDDGFSTFCTIHKCYNSHDWLIVLSILPSHVC